MRAFSCRNVTGRMTSRENGEVSRRGSGFGLDELVYRMEELANEKAFPELLRTIILVVDENLRLTVMLKNRLPAKCSCTCDSPDLVLDGYMPRKIRTRLGIVDLPRITRVKCKHCGKTFVPLTLMCGLEKHQTKSNELEKLVLEQCAQESYRVATGNIFVGGGRVFGPKPRLYRFKLNKKLKSLARCSALTYKAQENAIVLVEPFAMEAPKTKELMRILDALKAGQRKVLVVLPENSNNIFLSSRNLPEVKVITVDEINTYTVMNANSMVLVDGVQDVLAARVNR